MDESISDYIQRRLRRGREIALSRAADPNGGYYPPRLLKPVIDKSISNFLASDQVADRWIVMPGLRGVGKTTLLAQIYLDLADSNDQINLLYISLDQVVENLNANLYDSLRAYEQIIGCDLEAVDKPTFIFIDEVQTDPKWARTLKTVYDSAPRVFLFCTGSSAAHLQMDADIAGRRARVEKMHPLSFAEFQLLKYGLVPAEGLGQEIFRAIYHSGSAAQSHSRLAALGSSVKQEWVKYSKNTLDLYFKTGSLPATFGQKNPVLVGDSLRGMIDKVVDTDMKNYKDFDQASLASIKRLLFILAGSGDVISSEKLAQALDASRSQVFAFLDALVKAELLVRIPAHGSHLKASRKPARYLFASPAIRDFYHGIADTKTEATRRGLLLEDLAGLHYQRDLISTHKAAVSHSPDGQADFIVQMREGPKLAVEFGLGKKTDSQVAACVAEAGCDWGLTFATVDLDITKGGNIQIPLEYFFLL